MAEQKKRMGFLLGLGVFFVPFIFAWFTLAKSYSARDRVVAFGWMLICLLMPFLAPRNEVQNLKKTTSPARCAVTTTYAGMGVIYCPEDMTDAAVASEVVTLSQDSRYRHPHSRQFDIYRERSITPTDQSERDAVWRSHPGGEPVYGMFTINYQQKRFSYNCKREGSGDFVPCDELIDLYR